MKNKSNECITYCSGLKIFPDKMLADFFSLSGTDCLLKKNQLNQNETIFFLSPLLLVPFFSTFSSASCCDKRADGLPKSNVSALQKKVFQNDRFQPRRAIFGQFSLLFWTIERPETENHKQKTKKNCLLKMSNNSCVQFQTILMHYSDLGIHFNNSNEMALS